MSVRRAARWPWSKVRLSVRTQMTLLFAGVFTVITAAVLIAAQLVQQAVLGATVQDYPAGPQAVPPGGRRTGPKPPDPKSDLRHSLESSQRLITLLAILLIALLAFALCWWLAGRLLRPLHHVTATARRLSLSTLHERIGLSGPQDELKELADTFDAMLDRLERAVDSQRRFVANASHELRTPLAIQRTALEVGLDDPSPERLATIRAELLRNTRRSERLIEGLLVLARSERGLDARAPVDLAAVVGQVVREHLPLAGRGEVAVAADIARSVVVTGDEVLLTRLVANLVQNAIRHNHPGGRVTVALSPDAALVVANTGPRVPPDRVGELFEAFRRLHPDRTGRAGQAVEGAGLGLSIVAAITRAHGGTVHATPGPDGGLGVTVALPARCSPARCSPPRCSPPRCSSVTCSPVACSPVACSSVTRSPGPRSG